MNVEKRIVSSIIQRSLGISKDAQDIERLLNSYPIDWQRVKQFIGYHETISLAYLGLKKYSHLLPGDFRKFLKDNYFYNMLRNGYLLQEFLRLMKSFRENNLVIVPIKGMALLEDIYSNLSLRSMCDIDLLTQEKDISKAGKIFSQSGYQKELLGFREDYWRKRQYHLSFRKESLRVPVTVELHWALDYKRKENILPRLWERLRKINIDNQEIYLLSPEDTLFSLALHNRRLGKVLCLKNIVDLVLLLNKYRDFDWDYVLKTAREGRMRTTVFFILAQAKMFLGLKLPASVENSFKPPYWKRRVIYEFIRKNTFLPLEKIKPKELYLRSHFLLYDSLLEPIEYILKIPQEQFAKFYDLKPYDKRTRFFYKNRLLYIPIEGVIKLFSHT